MSGRGLVYFADPMSSRRRGFAPRFIYDTDPAAGAAVLMRGDSPEGALAFQPVAVVAPEIAGLPDQAT